jgi:hypothetical protein
MENQLTHPNLDAASASSQHMDLSAGGAPSAHELEQVLESTEAIRALMSTMSNPESAALLQAALEAASALSATGGLPSTVTDETAAHHQLLEEPPAPSPEVSTMDQALAQALSGLDGADTNAAVAAATAALAGSLGLDLTNPEAVEALASVMAGQLDVASLLEGLIGTNELNALAAAAAGTVVTEAEEDEQSIGV